MMPILQFGSRGTLLSAGRLKRWRRRITLLCRSKRREHEPPQGRAPPRACDEHISFGWHFMCRNSQRMMYLASNKRAMGLKCSRSEAKSSGSSEPAVLMVRQYWSCHRDNRPSRNLICDWYRRRTAKRKQRYVRAAYELVQRP